MQDFVNLEIDAAKIEGRMKGELYLASTVRSYSRHLKEIQQQKSAHPLFQMGN